ncbi:MAG: hypothetical protein Tsb0015_04920 [Simkaniaceae bacterium]
MSYKTFLNVICQLYLQEKAKIILETGEEVFIEQDKTKNIWKFTVKIKNLNCNEFQELFSPLGKFSFLPGNSFLQKGLRKDEVLFVQITRPLSRYIDFRRVARQILEDVNHWKCVENFL